MRGALVTGGAGFIGSRLVEALLGDGQEVARIVCRASTENFERIEHFRGQVKICQADLLDQLSVLNLLRRVRPREVYNPASMSFVPTSWEQPVVAGEFTALGVIRMLEAVWLVDREIRFYLLGRIPENPVRQLANAWAGRKIQGGEWT